MKCFFVFCFLKQLNLKRWLTKPSVGCENISSDKRWTAPCGIRGWLKCPFSYLVLPWEGELMCLLSDKELGWLHCFILRPSPSRCDHVLWCQQPFSSRHPWSLHLFAPVLWKLQIWERDDPDVLPQNCRWTLSADLFLWLCVSVYLVNFGLRQMELAY